MSFSKKLGNDITIEYEVRSSRENKTFCILNKVITGNNTEIIVLPSYLPDSVGGKFPLTTVNFNAFERVVCREVIFPDEITNLHDEALSYLTASKINIPKNVHTIPAGCFSYANIDTIVFDNPKGITTIEMKAFADLTTNVLVWPEGCTTISKDCFLGANISSIENIDEVTTIETAAFTGVCKLKSLKWPSKCMVIPEACFACAEIVHIENYEHVTCIEREAFNNTTFLREFKWPKACKTIPAFCFSHSGIQRILNISEVTSIEDSAFSRTPCLEEMRWPENCAVIPIRCFQQSSIQRIYNTSAIKTIDMDAFTDSNLENTQEFTGVETIKKNAFCSCSRLKRIIICNRDKKLTLVSSAFSGTNCLVEPSDIDKIDLIGLSDTGFWSLYAGYNTKICVHNVEGKDPITKISPRMLSKIVCGEISFPDTVEEFMSGCFNQASIKTLVIPPKVNSICERCFSWSLLEEIIFEEPSNILSIGEYAFSNTNKLKRFTWPAGCDTIPKGCFANSHIAQIDGIENVKSIHEGAFANTSMLQSFTWPKQCEIIPQRCFYMSGLFKIENISGVKQVREAAFLNSNLEGVYDLNNITRIEKGSFSGCCLEKLLLSNQGEALYINCMGVDFPIKISGNIESLEIKNLKNKEFVEIEVGFDTELIIR